MQLDTKLLGRPGLYFNVLNYDSPGLNFFPEFSFLGYNVSWKFFEEMGILMDGHLKQKHDGLIYVLSTKWLRFLIAYYIFFLIIGLLLSIYVISRLNYLANDDLLIYIITASLSVCSMFCSIQYLRRIYRACMDNRIIPPSEVLFLEELGNILYFVLRPFYAFAFVVIMIFAMLSGFVILSSSLSYIVNDRFLYLCVLISCITGFSIGRILDNFDAFSIEKINKILKHNEKE